MSQMYKECELRRFGGSKSHGRAERTVRWLPADDAVIGNVVTLGDESPKTRRGGDWEIVSAPEPALPATIVRRLDPHALPAEGRNA